MSNSETKSTDNMPANLRITVYIASKNYAHFLTSAIESVLRQTVDDWELLIIDDGSDDDTSEIMNLYRGHPNVSLHNTGGIGLPAVCNYAIDNSKGDYIVRLDGDDIFDPNILLVLGNYLDQNPGTALVFPDYYLMDDFGEVFAHERRATLYSSDQLLELPPNGACTMVRRKIFEEIGPYREDLGAQDGFDLWTKIYDRYKAANISLPMFYYRRHGANLTSNEQRILFARREIKKSATHEALAGAGPLIAVIPCRRNFDFVPDLWSSELNGVSLLERDIATCISSKFFDHIVVACDNLEAEDVLARFDDPRLAFHTRKLESTYRSSSIVPTLEEISSRFDPDLVGITVMRYIQTPFVSVGTLEEAITSMVMAKADSSIAVEELRSNLYRRTRLGMEEINRRHPLSTEVEPLYHKAHTCVATKNLNISRGSLSGAMVASFVVSAAESFFIASAHDLNIAQLMASGTKV